MSKVYKESELQSMKLVDLKALCKELKLKPTGTKAELIQRLVGIFHSSGAIVSNNHVDSSPNEKKDTKKRKKKKDEDYESPVDSPPPSPKRFVVPAAPVYPPGYLEFMQQMKQDNMATLSRIGLETNDNRTLLDLAQVDYLDRGKNVYTRDQLLELVRSRSNLRSVFFLSAVHLADDAMEALSRSAPNLAFISLRECLGVTDAGIKTLVTNCKKLIGLDISFCRVTSVGLRAIFDNLPQLRLIKLTNIKQITDDDFAGISSKCPNLQYVDGLEDQFTDSVLTHLMECRNLISVDCASQGFSPIGLAMLVSAHPKIILKNARVTVPTQSLPTNNDNHNVNNNDIIPHNNDNNTNNNNSHTSTNNNSSTPTESIPQSVQFDPNATELNLSNNNDVDSPSLTSILGQCTRLETLNLSNCRSLSDDALLAIGNSLSASTLTALDLSGVTNTFTDAGISALQNVKNLKKLSMDDCVDETVPLVQDSTLIDLVGHLPSLEELSIKNSPISLPNLKLLVDKVPKLEVLDVSGCSGEQKDYTSFYLGLKTHNIQRRGLHIVHETK